MIQRGQDFISDTSSNVGNVEESIYEGRDSELVILRERPGVEVETQQAGISDNNVGDRRA